MLFFLSFFFFNFISYVIFNNNFLTILNNKTFYFNKYLFNVEYIEYIEYINYSKNKIFIIINLFKFLINFFFFK